MSSEPAHPLSTTPTNTPRYDARLVQEAIVLAGRLQDEHRETMTVAEVEAVAHEIGVQPAFVHEALARLQQQQAPPPKPSFFSTPNLPPINTKGLGRVWDKFNRTPPALWWSLGWIAPAAADTLHAGNASEFLALMWIGGGIYLSIMRKGQRKQEAQMLVAAQRDNISREELLNTLFRLQKQLDKDKQTRAFLSIDVVGSSEMKRASSELAVEYSFGQYQHWIEERVRHEGGLVQSTAGDGTMCVFENEETALQTANILLADLARFNREQNRLPQPFQIRCGVNTGAVAVDPFVPLGNWQSPVIDRAAYLQKTTAPNTVSVGSPTA